MSDDRIGQLMERVEALEAQVRTLMAFVVERGRVERETEPAAPMPCEVDRADAVVIVGATMRLLFASLTPTYRAEALAEGSPADTLATVAASPHITESRDQLRAMEGYARAHSLTWDDLGMTA